MTIAHVGDGDTGAVARAKINQAIDVANAGSAIAVTGDITISSANAATYNGMTLVFDAAHTVTLDVGLPSNFGFAAQPPASGNASIASDGTVFLNGATTTITRAASNILFGVAAVGTDTYAVTGS